MAAPQAGPDPGLHGREPTEEELAEEEAAPRRAGGEAGTRSFTIYWS
jgi:hypothetical protein